MASLRTDILFASAGGSIPAQGETIKVTVSTSAATSSALVAGQVYDMVCDVDVAVCQSATAGANDAVFADDYFIPAGTIITFSVDPNYLYISAEAGEGGTLRISPREAVGVVNE